MAIVLSPIDTRKLRIDREIYSRGFPTQSTIASRGARFTLFSTPFHAHCVGFRGPVHGDWRCTGCRPRGLAKRRRRRARALRALLSAHVLDATRTTPAEPRHAPCD